MMEDCATSMSAPHGCTDDTAVIESFKEALTGRVGAERFRMWFTHGVTIAVDRGVGGAESTAETVHAAPLVTTEQSPEPARRITLSIRGQFALDRLRQNFIREMRGAAMQACGVRTEVVLRLDEPAATQAQLPLNDNEVCDRDGDAVGGPVPADTPGSGSADLADRHLNHETVPDRVSTTTERESSGSHQRQGKRAPNTKSKRRRTQSISSYIADGQASNSRTSKNRLRIDQPEQLEFPGLAAAKRSGTPNSAPATTGSSDGSPAPAKPQADKPTNPALKGGQPQVPTHTDIQRPSTVAKFIAGTSNQLAYTAMSMVCQDPKTASPIFFCGPTGTGKTHLMAAIADQLRRRHRMRRVMHLSAEQFTNDFISSVGNSGITAFRRRYREVDALLIDDVQFLGAKKATLREMLYTVETLASEGRPLLFSGLQAPSEIAGLSQELAGRMASGLVCPIQPLDIDIRRTVLERWIAERCPLEVPSALLDQINPMLAGDGRVVSGVANMINTLQRMFGRVPTLDEIRQFGGNLLRASTPIATLSVIETAVCDAFHLPHHTLRGRSQTRAVTGPRMLAMYLARQLTASAYSEIANHFGGKSH
ncbi:MAG: DnaA ATPase domain-containing protein, partial [Rubripirellula sp.]